MPDRDIACTPQRIVALLAREEARFRERNPRSASLAGQLRRLCAAFEDVLTSSGFAALPA